MISYLILIVMLTSRKSVSPGTPRKKLRFDVKRLIARMPWWWICRSRELIWWWNPGWPRRLLWLLRLWI